MVAAAGCGECLTDFDCFGLNGKSSCKLPKCIGGACVLSPLAVGATCKIPGEPPADCSENRCNAEGSCAAVAVGDASPCGFGSCGKKCLAGSCVAATAADFDDGNPCTKDFCDQGHKVVHEPETDLTIVCDDGDVCTAHDSCLQGKCKGQTNDCADGVACTVDGCDKVSGCTHTADAKACDDGNPCSIDACDAAAGCTVTAASGGAPCDDGNTCTAQDTCTATGSCMGTATKTCTGDACDVGGGFCSHAANANPCSDGSACTAGDGCSGGKCLSGRATFCSDGSGCTDDACNPSTGGCQFVHNSAPCSDGNGCTVGDTCKFGACAAGIVKSRNDNDVCTNDGCTTSTGACTAVANSNGCTDGNACTSGDVCSAGTCKPGGPITCNDGNLCTTDTCSTGKFGCTYTPVPDGKTCGKFLCGRLTCFGYCEAGMCIKDGLF